MNTTKSLRIHIRDRLNSLYPASEADQLAALMIEDQFGISISAQLLNPSIHVSTKIEKMINSMVERLRQHEPIQYVIGYTEFFGHRFKTDRRALIPRPETEELVQMVLQQDLKTSSKILDIGTGTGCIAISLALASKSTVYAVDVDKDSLELAKENSNALNANVRFILSDFLKMQLELPKLDIIVSNPPYVPDSDFESIESKVKDFEPSKALFVSDQDPLIFYKRIVDLAPFYLKPGAQVFMEIYHLAGPDIIKVFQGPHWSQVKVTKDINEKDRLLQAVFQSN